MGTVVIVGGDGLEALLSGGVPDLKLDLLPIGFQGSDFEIHADRRYVRITEGLVGELQEKAALANRGVANDEDFWGQKKKTDCRGGRNRPLATVAIEIL
jgi:hypothetical protein